MVIPPSVKPSRISLAKFHPINDVLHQAFMIKDLDLFKHFLGLEVAHSKQGISHVKELNFLTFIFKSSISPPSYIK